MPVLNPLGLYNKPNEPVLQIRAFTQLDQSPYFVVLHGKYVGHGDILFKTKKLPLKEDGSFDLEIEIQGKQTDQGIGRASDEFNR